MTATLILALLIPTEPPPAEATEPTVRLVIDFGDHVEWHYTAIPHTKEMTVFDAMKAVEQGPRGLSFRSTGAGETVFVSEIAGAANEGGGRGKRNWIFRVNDELAKESCGTRTVAPDDTIRWTYTTRGLAP